MNCLELLESFLSELHIKKEAYAKALEKIKKQSIEDESTIEYEDGRMTIVKILIDTYCLNSKNVKIIADRISKDCTPIGRREKDLIKHYLDYKDKESFDLIFHEICKNADQDYLRMLFEFYSEDYSQQVIDKFIDNWNIASECEDESKKYDYLQGIYSKIIPIFNVEKISLHEIFNYNRKFINGDLSSESLKKLEAFCDNAQKKPAKESRKEFCLFYQKLLNLDLIKKSNDNELETLMNKCFSLDTPFQKFEAEQFGEIIINLNQVLFNTCPDFSSFMDLVLSTIQQSYRLLKNHRTLAVHIENIYDNGKNIKWLLYSFIGIYAEHFIPTKEKRKFYRPEVLCIDRCKQLGINVTNEDEALFKRYFDGNTQKKELVERFANVNVDDIILDFDNIWYGYTFSDCLSVIDGDFMQNEEISFIKNQNEIVLIFNKYRHDDRKIPCPECAGLDISGNSFPEVGLRSWECKNIICPSRSKSNRGKRYSDKSNFMQRGYEEGKDIISKDLIKKWRRDIINAQSADEIYEMLLQYFSFSGENILIINKDNLKQNYGRNVLSEKYDYTIISENGNGLFNCYFKDGKYIKRYLNIEFNDGQSLLCQDMTAVIKESNTSVLVKGDSKNVLSKLSDNIFDAAVTSPPYYNARLYSQWSNLYLYLSDMFEIIKQTYRTLKPGAIYLYNIGDICGNENTIVSSNMGNKRILLGAYTIHLFLAAGFELMDNILWDKGEPQSNRQKNDGKFTPFYQKPMNVYEHMFIFKKPGANAIVNVNAKEKLQDNWKTNISYFTPVIKINSKGENTLGHTAPFPADIPDFVCDVFTDKDRCLILEPFAGSGTSIISAQKHNRKCVGIELSEEYAKLIEDICKENNISIKRIDVN